MYDLISGVLGGAFGAYTYGPSGGAAAQNANADHWRRQQEEMMQNQPSPEQAAEAMRGAQNTYPYVLTVTNSSTTSATWFDRESARRYAEERIRGIDWLFWGLLTGMALALILRWWVSR